MNMLRQLTQQTERSRDQFLASVAQLTFVQANFQPDPDTWSILAITEHIVRAEQSGVMGMWRALDGIRNGSPVWSGEPVHRGLSIEEVIARTWQPKEKVPDIAAPIWGGSLSYWVAMLKVQRVLLQELAAALDGYDLETLIFPHPISGPLDVRQRLEFLRFHLDRHRDQVERVKAHPDFPC
ncbi:MAG TPA: DinB family protein [Blastocatellia bacterium]|nr:DinB family protein [Blastocatellia bacterium]